MIRYIKILQKPLRIFSILTLIMVISTLLATLLNDSSWFTLLLLATILGGLCLRPKTTLITSIILVIYTASYNLLFLEARFSAELFMVSLVWIISATVASAMNSLRHQLKIRESYYRHALALSPGALITLNPDHTIREWNRSAEELFGYSEEEAKERNIDFLITNGDPSVLARAHAISKRVTDLKSIERIRDFRYTKNGDAKQLLISGAPIQIDGEFHGVVAAYTDISELDAQEKSIRNLVHQKELLLKEVHHRVKNHMQSLIAMLNLYLDSHEDTGIRTELKDIQHKVQVMQSIYQHLYVDDRVDSIDLSDLIASIIDEFSETLPAQNPPTIELSAERISVAPDQALQVGIIVNELLTNAVKYARPAENRVEIRVSIRLIRKDRLEIIVRDNGREEITLSPENYGFGLILVEGYAAQADGEFRIEHNQEGNGFIVELDLVDIEE